MTIDQQNSSFNYDFDTNNNNSKSKFIIEERRWLVAKLWAQSKTETEIARELHCNVSTLQQVSSDNIHNTRTNSSKIE